MKNLTILFYAVGTALLLSSAASAQTAINQKSIDQSKQLYLIVSGEIDQLIARLPVTPPAAPIEQMKITNTSGRLALLADKEAAAGDWQQAQSDYQEALVLDPYEGTASYALGDDKLRHGDLKAAVAYYRKAIYNPPDATASTKTPLVFAPTFHEVNAFRLMEYARLLSLTGHQEEAQTVYKRGAHFVNYVDGQQKPPLLLLDFGTALGQITFTPARLQALAQVGWAENNVDFDIEGAKKRLDEAIALYPDSPVPYFFRGRYEIRYGKYLAADTDFDRVEQLGNEDTHAAVQKERNVFRFQFDAAEQAGQQAQQAPKPKQAGQ